MALQGKLPERYSTLIDFYEAGQANALDILRADFSHWPPNGLDIVNAPDFNVEFESAWGEADMYKQMAPGFSGTAITLGLGRIHPSLALTYLTLNTLKNAAKLRGFVLPKQPTTVHLNDMYRLGQFTLPGRRMLSHILTHEFKHVVQARDAKESLSSSMHEDRIPISKLLRDGVKKYERYLALEHEIQARLHTIIVGAYHQHAVLPTNRVELYSCLASQNIDVPLEYVDESLEDFTSKPDLFDRYADKLAIHNLNRVIRAIKEENQGRFWEEIMPFIYGDLIELYGDRLGHKRMGHSHNIQLREIFYRSAHDTGETVKTITRYLNQEKGHEILDMDTAMEIMRNQRDMMERALHLMEKDDAVDLACMLLSYTGYRELGTSQFSIHDIGNSSYKDLSNRAIHLIQGRNDLTPDDKELLKKATADYHPGNYGDKAARYKKRAGTEVAYPFLEKDYTIEL